MLSSYPDWQGMKLFRTYLMHEREGDLEISEDLMALPRYEQGCNANLFRINARNFAEQGLFVNKHICILMTPFYWNNNFFGCQWVDNYNSTTTTSRRNFGNWQYSESFQNDNFRCSQWPKFHQHFLFIALCCFQANMPLCARTGVWLLCLLPQLLMFSIFQNQRTNVYALTITFIFDRCTCNWTDSGLFLTHSGMLIE